MKIQIVVLSAMVLAAPLVRAEDAALKDEKAKVGYAIGVSIGMQWKRFGIEPDQVSLEEMNRGIKDLMSGAKPLLTDQEVQDTLRNFSQQQQAKQREKQRLEAEKNKKAGDAFLNENKAKPGVVTLPSGLQYKVLAEGKGESPKATDMVKVNYKGTLIDGTEFDSNAKHGGQPATFHVSNVPFGKGWTEALQLMKPGAKWQLFIPSELAFSDAGRGNVPPGSSLIFEVELLSAESPPAPVAAQPVTSDIIKVPSADEMKKGAKIETIKAEDLKKLEEEQRKQTEEQKKKEAAPAADKK